MTKAIVAVDVGGTTIDAAVVSDTGRLIGKLVEDVSASAGTKDDIIGALMKVIEAARAQAGSMFYRHAKPF